MPSRTKARPRVAKLSPTHAPPGMALADWQIALRRKVSTEQPLAMRNLGREPVFSEFAVTNKASERTYRVSIRGESPCMNYCTCPDYAVNTLGTCKHVEFVLGRLHRRHGAALRKGCRPAYTEVYVRYGSKRSVVFSPADGCPASLHRAARGCFDADGVLLPDKVEAFDRVTMSAVRSGHELRVYDDAMEAIAELRDARSRRSLLSRRYGSRGAEKAWRRLLKAELYPYQRDGALFAAQAGRAILADEMGLGKTIQAIAAAEILARDCGVERVLIICPASLKHQWKAEIERFSARPAVVIDGLLAARAARYAEPSFFKIVNYDVIHLDRSTIERWQPDLVILDEAQRIKNWQTRTAKSVKRISSRYALVLTGTPLENRLDELHSIVEFVDRHRLGPLFAFKAAHEVKEGDSARVVGYRGLNKVAETLKPILLRRTLSEVAKQLPPRMEKNFFVPMTDEQWAPHDENREIVARLVHKWRTHKFLSEADQLRLRIALQNMRMVCDSTYLIDHQTRHGVKVDELRRLLAEIMEDQTSKVVIFSQWVRMNELVAEMLEDARWGYVHLHGGVPSKKRAELTRALREEPDCRVFLSTDAGGVGLNLQSASTVINMDLPWNPAVLGQRIGRVHRLGQKRPVRVVNFIAEETIEHGMLSLLAFKKSVFAGVLDGATDQVFMGDSAMNRFMKTVDTATRSIPPSAVGRSMGLSAEDSNVETDASWDDDIPTEHANVPAEQSRESSAVQVASAPGMLLDARSIGVLLDQGAELLRQIGQSLAHGNDGEIIRTDGKSPISISTDAASGRRELRLPLPDEQTLAAWVGRLGQVFAGLQKR